MKPAVVISNEDQFKIFDSHCGGDWHVYQVLCDNPSFFSGLKKRGIAFERLDEFMLQDRWDPVNAWGCEKAAGWIRLWREAGGTGPNFAEIIFLEFGYALVQGLKNRLYAEMIFETLRPDALVLFEMRQIRRYPEFSGNSFLNYFLKRIAGEKGTACRILTEPGNESLRPQALDSRPAVYVRLTRKAKGLLKKIVSVFTRVSAPVDVLAYGSLRHLGSVLDELKKRGLRTALYDFDFHKDQFFFSISRKLPYLLPGISPLTKEEAGVADAFAHEFEGRFNRVWELTAGRRFFSFEGRDLSSFVRSELLREVEIYFRGLGREAILYGRLAKQAGARAILLDEDFAPQRSFFATFMTGRGVRSYCISHANLAVDFKTPAECRLFGKSLTVVQSDFEKDAYAARGWDPSKIVALGTPRYDRLALKITADPPSLRPRRRPYRLLCVASALYPQTPDSVAYLGCHVYCLGELQRVFLDAVFEAVTDLEVEVVIKPHDQEDEALWRELAKNSSVASQVKVVQSSRNFVDLMLESDALVLSFWSTTMIEGGLAGMPVFYLDIPAQRGPVLAVWQEKNYCNLFADAGSFRKELQRRLDPHADIQPRSKKPEDDYFLGPLDAKSTARVADQIEKDLKYQEVLKC